MSDYSGVKHLLDLLKEQSTDAYQWARATQGALFETNGVILDISYLHTIMANAIEATRDSFYNNKVKPLEQKVEKLKRLILLTDPIVESEVMNDIAQRQYLEFIRVFPDEHPEAIERIGEPKMIASREMNLKEWVETLPDIHFARREYEKTLNKIKLQDQRIENLLKAVEFYSNISTTMQTETALLVRDGFEGDFYPIQLKAAEALTRDKELMSGK